MMDSQTACRRTSASGSFQAACAWMGHLPSQSFHATEVSLVSAWTGSGLGPSFHIGVASASSGMDVWSQACQSGLFRARLWISTKCKLLSLRFAQAANCLFLPRSSHGSAAFQARDAHMRTCLKQLSVQVGVWHRTATVPFHLFAIVAVAQLGCSARIAMAKPRALALLAVAAAELDRPWLWGCGFGSLPGCQPGCP